MLVFGSRRLAFCWRICLALATLSTTTGVHAAAADVRDRAVISLTFDAPAAAGSAAAPATAVTLTDSARSGSTPDNAALPNGGTAIPSAFVPGSGGQSLLLDPAQRQVLTIPGMGDASCPAAVTISGLFASLHPLTDNAFHGLLARRQPAAPSLTNYGINYNPAADAFQVYVNDGKGFKVAVYSFRNVLGARRRTHLTATFETADAPGADADTDADDVRIRLFVNGQPVTPGSAAAGFVDGAAAWLTDVKLDACLSDTPLTVGGSFVDGELSRLVCDDLHVFAEALPDADALALFQAVAGSAAADLLREQKGEVPAAAAAPVIGRLSQYALTTGQTSRLTIFGNHLTNARLQPGLHGLTAKPVDGNNAGQATFEVTVPKDVVPGRYLLRVATDAGVSRPVMFSLDGLPQHADQQFTEAAPAPDTAAPFAVSGVISGTEQKRVYFHGRSGQRVTVEVEARRIGSRLDPVVEIRSAQATPLTVQWQQADLAGDARAVTTLPADGLYFAELHDLQYRAPGNSPWRLLIGDLPASSLAYPPALADASTAIRVAGRAGLSDAVTVRAAGGAAAVEAGQALLPLPRLLATTGREVTEPVDGTFDEMPLDATFTTAPFQPLYVNGRIVTAGETDQFVLTVTPGQALHLSVAARSLSSPLRPQLAVFRGDERIAFSDGDSGAADPAVDVTVAEGVTQLRIQLQDFTGNGTPTSVYRLLVSRKDRPAFLLQTRDDTLSLPVNGSAPLRLSVIRQSPAFRYTGPIRLHAAGVPGLSIVPDLIPASEQNQQVLVVLTRTQAAGQADHADFSSAEPRLSIRGESEGLEGGAAAELEVLLESVPAGRLTFAEQEIVAAETAAIPALVTLDAVPPVLLRGLPATLSVRVLPLQPATEAFVRLEMITTETPRRVDPNNPNSAVKPMVAAPEFQFGTASQSVFSLPLNVPLDVAENTIDAVFAAEFVSQPLAPPATARAWTAPVRLTVDHAVTIRPPAEPVKSSKAATASLSGSLQRHPQFSEPVTLIVDGLPAGYTAMPVTVPADQSAFTLSVAIPDSATAGEVPGLTVRGQTSSGAPITAPIPLKLVVE